MCMLAADRRETTGMDEEPDAGSTAVDRATPEERNRLQFAALPYRVAAEGGLEILLITSRSTRRWIIPKGWPMGKRPAHKVAAQEAAEEAGVEGKVGKRAIGSYHYDKVLSTGAVARCRVEVYALEVRRQNSAWPERKRRERRWMDVTEAATLIDDVELAPLIRGFAPPGG